MRVSSSRHEGSARQSFRLGSTSYRELNVPLLVLLLRSQAPDAAQTVKEGKKRARSPESVAPPATAKRAKTDAGALAVGPTAFTIYQHVFEMDYNTHVTPDVSPDASPDASAAPDDSDNESVVLAKDGALGDSLALEEGTLFEWIHEWCGDTTESKEVDIGPLYMRQHAGRSLLVTDLSSAAWNPRDGKYEGPQAAPEACLLVAPPIGDGQDNGCDSSSSEELWSICAQLANSGRIRIDLRARFVVLPTGVRDVGGQQGMPFRLHIEFKVTLLFPAIGQPVPHTQKSKVMSLEEAQRRLFAHIFPHLVPSDVRDADADIPFFYSVLGPAPPLLSASADEAAQPAELLPALLPFQRRSVAWLLKREGKTISPAGTIVPIALDDAVLPLFWSKVEVPTGPTLYVNHLTAVVLTERPLEDTTLGGILAEEPGLGKTLEVIALVLINPSVGRNPTTKRWDPVAKVFVKEIKTTLVVTPASLATQWADEFRLHAPSLRVLIYDGWTKVPVPITEDDAEDEKEKRKKSKAQGKRKGKARSGPKPSARTVNANGIRHTRVASTRLKSFGRRLDEDMDIDDAGKDETPDDDNADEDEEILDWCAYVNTFDVCITTYNVLQQDLGVARAPPVRPRRDNARYSNVERPRSPLVMCEWYRVVMDEVQMVGGGKAEEMVSFIPRLSSFAVSGTPARAQVADLIHVLKFLRIDAVLNIPRAWSRLILPSFADQFKALFQKYTIRTMKASVKHELTIPQQTRYLVPVELGRVERQVYEETLERALDELGLDARGVAASEGWAVDTSVLRSWLRKLRGITTHPQVGQLLNPADKLNKHGVLKSIGEVLEGMCDQNWRNLMDDRKKKVESLTRGGQLQQHDQGNPRRYQRGLELLLQAENEANHLIDDVKRAISQHDLRGDDLKKEAAAMRESRDQVAADGGTELAVFTSTRKGKGRATSEHYESEDEDQEESSDENGAARLDDLPGTPAGIEHASKRRALVQRLRECNLTLHKVKFLQGDVYHVLGAAHAAAEDAAYASAERLRRDLLKYTEAAALRAMSHLERKSAGKNVTEKELLVPMPYCDQGGIRSAAMMEEANEIIEEILNPQTDLLWEWRKLIYDLLTEKMSADDDNATGQEYAKSLETQGRAEVLLQAYAALLSDRREVLVAERTTLAAQHNVKAKPKGRKTKAAGRAKDALEAMLLDNPDAIEAIASLEPEHQVLANELADERKELMNRFDGRAIKSVMVELSEVVVRISNEKDPEREIAKDGAHRLRTLINTQHTLADKLENDLSQLRKAFNERILYFRQLQEISDSVVDVEWEGQLMEVLQEAVLEQTALDVRINSNKARQRYLENLAMGKQTGDPDEDEDACILCRCDFIRGYITQCAHAFCEGCMKAWLSRKEGKVCPVCRVMINVDQLQRFSIGEKPSAQAPPQMLNAEGEVAPKSLRQIEYNFVQPDLLAEIQSVESYGSYGSKIETLVRHLLHIQLKDPGAKSIIFSAWADSLLIIQHALVSNGIPCLRIDQSSRKENAAKRFRTDPGILVLLLHGERENAGLNITCASRVFLVESVVNHAFEMQAIARVDRMGQKRETEVYCYYAEDTVERNILDLAARQGLSLYTKDNSAGTLTAGPLAGVEKGTGSPSKKVKKMKQKGDFIFSTDDMLAILFPTMYEELEYLLPADRDGVARIPPRPQYTNSEPGPSRLAA